MVELTKAGYKRTLPPQLLDLARGLGVVKDSTVSAHESASRVVKAGGLSAVRISGRHAPGTDIA